MPEQDLETQLGQAMAEHDITPDPSARDAWLRRRRLRGWIPPAAVAACVALTATIVVVAQPNHQPTGSSTATNTISSTSTAATSQVTAPSPSTSASTAASTRSVPSAVTTVVGGTGQFPTPATPRKGKGPRSPESVPKTTTFRPEPTDERQEVVFAGASLLVPATWPMDQSSCSTPTTDTVLFFYPDGMGHVACAKGRPAGLSTVEFAHPASMGSLFGFDTTHVGNRSSTPQGTAFDWQSEGTTIVIVIPSLDVAIRIITPDAALRRQIFDSLQTVSVVEPTGCCSSG